MMERIAGVIAEYNPFHNGHLHQFRQIRASGVEGIVVCMSGNFVQRCEPALCEKHRRALSAVKNGADLVVEMPFPYPVLSAEWFASAGVFLLTATGVVSDLYFGCESADIPELARSYRALCEAEKSGAIAGRMKSGLSFPLARAEALREYGAFWIPQKPNDILAFEYYKAIQRQNSPLQPCALHRIGEYHSEFPCGQVLSASGIRRRFLDGEDVSAYLPESSFQMLSDAKERRIFVPPDALDQAVLAGLFHASLRPKGSCSRFYGVVEGLENRIFAAVEQCFAEGKKDLESVCRIAGTKRYTLSAVRRAAYSIFFELENIPAFPPYLHVLAFNEKGRELLRRMKQGSSLPVFHTLPADPLSEYASFVKREIFADSLYFLAGGGLSAKEINSFTANSIFTGKI